DRSVLRGLGQAQDLDHVLEISEAFLRSVQIAGDALESGVHRHVPGELRFVRRERAREADDRRFERSLIVEDLGRTALMNGELQIDRGIAETLRDLERGREERIGLLEASLEPRNDRAMKRNEEIHLRLTKLARDLGVGFDRFLSLFEIAELDLI